MSQSAANVKLFFPFHSCLESIQADTLLPDGAEDKALLGSNLSADSGAKTRLGFRASWTPAVRFEKHNWDWHQQRQNPRGMGDRVPILTRSPPLKWISRQLRSIVASVPSSDTCLRLRSLHELIPPPGFRNHYSASRASELNALTLALTKEPAASLEARCKLPIS